MLGPKGCENFGGMGGSSADANKHFPSHFVAVLGACSHMIRTGHHHKFSAWFVDRAASNFFSISRTGPGPSPVQARARSRTWAGIRARTQARAQGKACAPTSH